VAESLERELASMGEVGKSALAAAALVLARQLDDPKVSATAKAMCARTLADALATLRERAAEETQEVSVVDQLLARRAARDAAP